MSDLLQRMIQRTRTPQPAIEPAPLSRYAPDAPGMGAAAARGLESEAQSDSHAATPHGIKGQDRSLGQTKSRTPSRRPVMTDAGEASTASTTNPIGPLGTDQGRRPTPSSMHPAETATIRSIENLQEEFSAAAEQAQDALNMLPRKAAAVTGSLVHSADEVPAPKTPLDAADPARRDAVPVAQPLLARATPPAAQVREQPSQTEYAPEINISIGHIELRAARVAESPRKPAFRPQLSLDDFLHGKSGASR